MVMGSAQLVGLAVLLVTTRFAGTTAGDTCDDAHGNEALPQTASRALLQRGNAVMKPMEAEQKENEEAKQRPKYVKAAYAKLMDARKAKVEAERMAKEAGVKLAKKIAMWKEDLTTAMEDATKAAMVNVDAAQKAYEEAILKEKQLDKEMAKKTAQSIAIKKAVQKQAEDAKAKLERARRALKDTTTDEQARHLKDSMMAAKKELEEIKQTAKKNKREMVKEMDELTAGKLKVETMVKDAKARLAAAQHAILEAKQMAREKAEATAKEEIEPLKAEQKAMEEQVTAAKVRVKAARKAFEAAKQRARGQGK